MKDIRINEATRSQLIQKSKNDAKALSKTHRSNRWNKKNKCLVANTVADYNKVDMDTFWKKDILVFKIKVKGETSLYYVTVEFSHILEKLQKKVAENHNKLELKLIYSCLLNALNSSDIKVDCTCPDFKYRFKVWATKNGYNSGKAENREAKITNPNNNLGAACKHILNVLNNAEWLKKVASVINNYINYCKDNTQYNYSKFIFPKIYGIPYDKAVQMTLSDYDSEGNLKNKLESDEDLINLSNALGRVRGRIKKGSNKNPIADAERKAKAKK